MDDRTAETINLLAGRGSSGNPVYEEVLVERRSGQQYKLLRSPGLVLGIAADDVIAVVGDGTYDVLERGGNLCIQIFARGDLTVLEETATEKLMPLRGRLDGKAKTQLVYTIPVTAGFPAVESVLNELVAQAPGAEWYYGNVYDTSDGVTPLNWWT